MRTTGMSRCMISIPRPRPVGWPEGGRLAATAPGTGGIGGARSGCARGRRARRRRGHRRTGHRRRGQPATGARLEWTRSSVATETTTNTSTKVTTAPDTASGGGIGLWLARQLADVVTIHLGTAETTVE